MHREHGLTSIIATHNPRLAAVCDRVLRLERTAVLAPALRPASPSRATFGRSCNPVAAADGALPYNAISASDAVASTAAGGRMFERYTERARRVLFFARYEASQLGSVSIETEHLLLGLIREGKGLTSRIFARSHLVAREHPQGDRRPDGASARRCRRRSRSRSAPRPSACCSSPPRRPTACCTPTSAPSTCCSASCARSGRWPRRS